MRNEVSNPLFCNLDKQVQLFSCAGVRTKHRECYIQDGCDDDDNDENNLAYEDDARAQRYSCGKVAWKKRHQSILRLFRMW